MHWNGRQMEHTTHAKQDEKKTTTTQIAIEID